MTGDAKKLVEKITDFAPKSVKASADNGQVFVAFTSVDEAIGPRSEMTSVAFDTTVV
jgi:hypothetical protein